MTSLPWYHRTTLYQVYPRSFHDSNGDGIGDLPGILGKLDYLQALGVETLWISPFFASPQADFGYDVSGYRDIAPEYGSLEDALELIEAVHRRGMRILFDMVLNHTSSEHPWFRESRSSRRGPRADWYIWRDRPNNWQSVTGGSGWHYAEERGQYYWATFLPFQPDLNYRNPQVRQAMLDVLRFWLARGVDGFRLDIFNHIYKDAGFRPNPFSFRLLPAHDDPSGFFQQARYTVNRPESFEFARALRQVCDEFGEKLTLGEVTGDRQTIRRFLGDRENDGLTLVFDFGMLDFRFTAEYFRGLIGAMEAHYPPPFMPVYTFGNHDRRRSMSRLGGDLRKARLLHMLQLTVRGVPCIYYGEEIGMTNARFPFRSALDPVPHKFRFLPRSLSDALGLTINRDEVRTPMQWDGTRNAGFSTADRTWLPVHENYREVNVDLESRDGASLLSTVRALLRIRRERPVLQEGALGLVRDLPGNVLGFTRSLEEERLLVLLNFGPGEREFQAGAGECLFRLTAADRWQAGWVRLAGHGGMILRLPGQSGS